MTSNTKTSGKAIVAIYVLELVRRVCAASLTEKVNRIAFAIKHDTC